MQQKTLFKLKDYGSEFGGSRLSGRRKTARPLSPRNPLKVVLKSDRATSPHLTQVRSDIGQIFKQFSEIFSIKIYEYAACGDHIHFVGLFRSQSSYIKFIRALTGTLARKLSIKFKFRPWSRILHWGRSLEIAIQYTLQNHLESIGAIPYQPRAKDLAQTKRLLCEVQRLRLWRKTTVS